MRKYRRQTKFDRRTYYANHPGEYYQMDLIDFNKSGYGYVLNCIDVYSRYADSEKIASKNEKAVLQGIINIFERMGKPENLQTDKEPAILGHQIRQYFKDNNINLYHVPNAYDGGYSAPIVERLNRTYKDKFYDYKEKHNKPFKALVGEFTKQFPSDYNSDVHRTIKITPNEAWTETERATDIYKNIQKLDDAKNDPKQSLKVGQYVRIQKPEKAIEKKMVEKYYDEICVVSEVLNTKPTTYKLKSVDDDTEIEGSYYKQQLLIVDKLPDKKPEIKRSSNVESLVDRFKSVKHSIQNTKTKREIKPTQFLTY